MFHDKSAKGVVANNLLQNSQQFGHIPLARTENPYSLDSARTTTLKRPVTRNNYSRGRNAMKKDRSYPCIQFNLRAVFRFTILLALVVGWVCDRTHLDAELRNERFERAKAVELNRQLNSWFARTHPDEKIPAFYYSISMP
jgi:hypothetical protein